MEDKKLCIVSILLLIGSETIEENGVVNCVACSTDIEREKSGEPSISCMVDRIKELK